MNTKDVREIVIASGKGGVGKSMVSSSLAIWLARRSESLVAVDCDVDAPNLAIWLNEIGGWDKTAKLETSNRAFVDWEKCIGCGLCQQKCVFGAITMVEKKSVVSPFLCEGCGRCAFNCPTKAISIRPVKNGSLNIKNTKYGFPLVSGQLHPGESGSGEIVSAVKDQAAKLDKKTMIVDSSPGTGCPVTAALRDADYALLVTEPSPSGWEDLRNILAVVDHFRIEYGIIINKWDVNPGLSEKIANHFPINFLGKISYDQRIFSAVANLQPVMETNLPAPKELEDIFNKLLTKL